jgi:hypothetical protein
LTPAISTSLHFRFPFSSEKKEQKQNMSKPTNTATPNPNNPSSLKSRYEIRKLDAKHIPWATAILGHSHGFHSSMFQDMWPEKDFGEWVHSVMPGLEYIVRHQINSGLSYGVFDLEYAFKTREAEACGGKLFWDASEPSIERSQGRAAEEQRMLSQMDFPLVSIALSYDGIKPFDPDKMTPLLEALPEYGLLYAILEKRDPRPPESWKPTESGQVLMRGATSTRAEYEGQGIMAATARWLRREAALMGFRGVQIECAANAVTHVWSEGVEAPFRGRVISEFDTETWEDENGVRVFGRAKLRITKCWVDLVPEEGRL